MLSSCPRESSSSTSFPPSRRYLWVWSEAIPSRLDQSFVPTVSISTCTLSPVFAASISSRSSVAEPSTDSRSEPFMYTKTVTVSVPSPFGTTSFSLTISAGNVTSSTPELSEFWRSNAGSFLSLSFATRSLTVSPASPVSSSSGKSMRITNNTIMATTRFRTNRNRRPFFCFFPTLFFPLSNVPRRLSCACPCS